jgi:nitrate/nitrite transporter NarK
LFFLFVCFCRRFLERQFHLTAQEGGRITSVPNICACVFSLFMGFFIDRFGGRGILGAILTVSLSWCPCFSSIPPFFSRSLAIPHHLGLTHWYSLVGCCFCHACVSAACFQRCHSVSSSHHAWSGLRTGAGCDLASAVTGASHGCL